MGKAGSQTSQGEVAGAPGRPGETFASCQVSEGPGDVQRTAQISALLSCLVFADLCRNNPSPDLEADVPKAK